MNFANPSNHYERKSENSFRLGSIFVFVENLAVIHQVIRCVFRDFFVEIFSHDMQKIGKTINSVSHHC